MTFADFLANYWWVFFPFFGMLIPIIAILGANRRATELMRVMNSYAAQGKDPPPEILAMTNRTLNEVGESDNPNPVNRWWAPLAFLALTAGFGVAYWSIRATEDWSWVFLMLTVTFGVFAIGGSVIALFGRKP
jgi:hypothetical protein